MEASPPTSDGIEAELDRIEGAVAAGDTDLSALGFWRLVGRVKRDPALVAVFADRIGAIDTRVFRARVRLRAPVWLGNLVLLAGVVVGAGLVAVAARTDGALAGLALVAAAGVWAVAVHAPAHWVVGRLWGIAFTDYFLGGPPPPRPGLKTAYGSYLRCPPGRRAWFHASGAIATKIAPFVVLALAPLTKAPTWAVLAVLAIGIVQIVTDVTLSVRSSDWKKFLRERAVARDLAVKG